MTVSQQRVDAMLARESETFVATRPRSRALLERARQSMPDGVPMAWMVSNFHHPPIFVSEGQGAWFTDVDGHRYLDMNLADSSMACGYGTPELVAAAERQMARGSQFLMPCEDSIEVAEELARRFGLPFWQFTLSASSANTEAIRLARARTGRSGIVLFEGKYHGMLDETLHALEEGRLVPEGLGLPSRAAEHTHIVPFNDLAHVEKVLETHEVACVLAEPAPANLGGVLIPEPGFLSGLRELTRQHGCLLVLDETHTQSYAFGGLKRAWGLECDVVVLGKVLGGGLPIGAWGMTAELGEFIAEDEDSPQGMAGWTERLAIGGTLFGYALGMATAIAVLRHVLTEEAYGRTAALGGRLADGIQEAIDRHGLPWSTHRLFSRSGYHFAPDLPRNARDAFEAENIALREALRVFMANRGVWEAMAHAGPAVSFSATENDIDFYLNVLDQGLGALTRDRSD